MARSTLLVICMALGLAAGLAAQEQAPTTPPTPAEAIVQGSRVRVTETPAVGGAVVRGTWIGVQADKVVIQTDKRTEQLRAFSRESVAQLEVGQRGKAGMYAGMVVRGLVGFGVASGIEPEDSFEAAYAGFLFRMIPVALGSVAGMALGHQLDRVEWSPVEW